MELPEELQKQLARELVELTQERLKPFSDSQSPKGYFVGSFASSRGSLGDEGEPGSGLSISGVSKPTAVGG